MPQTVRKLKIALCDDSVSDRENMLAMLAKYLDQHHYVVQIDTYASGEAFLSAETAIYDLVVLDIYMAELNDIQVAEKLVREHPGVQIIFCSTSNAYAAESYDVSALRYLIKSVPEDKLFRTLDRFFHAYTALRTLTFKQNRMDEHIYLSEVLWIEAGDHKSVIHTRNAQITKGLNSSNCASR